MLDGCEAPFRPEHWRERYCSPACRAEAKRWHAAKRQRRHRERESPAERKQRCAEEKKRRRDRKEAAAEAGGVAGRGHAKTSLPLGPICDRPGCYDPPVESRSASARFCCEACRRAVRRVIDRETKWRHRVTASGRYKRGLEYARRRSRSNAIGSNSAPTYPSPS